MKEPSKVIFFILSFLLLCSIVIRFPVFFVTKDNVAFNFTFTWLFSESKFILATKTESIVLVKCRCRFTHKFYRWYHHLYLVQHIAVLLAFKMVSLNIISLSKETRTLAFIWLGRGLSGTLSSEVELLVFGRILFQSWIVLNHSLSKTIFSCTDIGSIHCLGFVDFRQSDIFKYKHATSSMIVWLIIFLMTLVFKDKQALSSMSIILLLASEERRWLNSSNSSYFLRRNEFIFKIKP